MQRSDVTGEISFSQVIGDIRNERLKLHLHMRCGDVEHDIKPIVDALRQRRVGQAVVISCATFRIMLDVVEASFEGQPGVGGQQRRARPGPHPFSRIRSRNRLKPSTLVPPSPKVSKLKGLMM